MIKQIQLPTVAILLTSIMALAQTPQVTSKDIAALVELSFTNEEIIESLSRKGVTLDVPLLAAQRLRDTPATRAIGVWLIQKLTPKAPAQTISVADIIRAWKAHAGEAAIRALIERSESVKELQVDDIISLTQAGVPTDLIRHIASARSMTSKDETSRANSPSKSNERNPLA